MKNYTGLRFRIADKIFIINKYILLVLLEKRENPANIGHLFDRKVLMTSLLSKIEPMRTDIDAGLVSSLKNKLSDIAESDKLIIDILIDRKGYAAGKISALKKISAAVRAYGANNNQLNI